MRHSGSTSYANLPSCHASASQNTLSASRAFVVRVLIHHLGSWWPEATYNRIEWPPFELHTCHVHVLFKDIALLWAQPGISYDVKSNRNIFRVTGPLWGESIGHRQTPLTKASFAELWCFLLSAPEQTVEKTIGRWLFETPSRSLWRHCNATHPSKYFTRRFHFSRSTWVRQKALMFPSYHYDFLRLSSCI